MIDSLGVGAVLNVVGGTVTGTSRRALERELSSEDACGYGWEEKRAGLTVSRHVCDFDAGHVSETHECVCGKSVMPIGEGT